jgi:hypothetical protein
MIVDYRKDAIKAVLGLQQQMHEQQQPGTPFTPDVLELALRKESSKASSCARRFARLLGKQDAAIAKALQKLE